MNTQTFGLIRKEISGYKFNHMFNNVSFIKLTTKTENHNGFIFSDGLNVDTLQFNPKGSCQKGGIYFTEEKEAWRWIHYKGKNMNFMRHVTIPDDARVYVEEHKFKTDKIILGPKKLISRKIYMQSIMKYGHMLAYVPPILRDRIMCIEAVKNSNTAFKYVPLNIIDKEICTEFVKKNNDISHLGIIEIYQHQCQHQCQHQFQNQFQNQHK